MALGTTAQAGKDLLIKVKNDAGSPTLVAMVGLRTKSIKFNAEIVDITNSDSTNSFRELLGGVGVKSMSTSGAGVAQNFAAIEVLRDMMFDGTLRDCEVVIPGLGTAACKCKISALELGGEHNKELTFSATLESSGDITWTAA